ncbi:MAG: hypothetical protein AAGH72_03930 [Verrucomicrobiota bacterium]
MTSSALRIAIIDIGSNSIKLLVADFSNGNLLETVHFEADNIRIGGFLGMGSRTMTEKAMRAGAASVEKLLQQAKTYHPQKTAIVATSAVREAENRAIFCKQITEITGHAVNLLSGQQEAEAIALGAGCDPDLKNLKEFYMFDLGGGSLELIHWTPKITELVSLPLGAVRLYKKYQQSDPGPLNLEHRQAIEEAVDQHWDQVPWLNTISSAPWIGTGGALNLIRSLLAERQELSFDAFSARLSYTQLADFLAEIAVLSIVERMRYIHIPASRADILPAGLTAILQLLNRAKAPELIHSMYNLRYGYAAKVAAASK